MYVVYSEYESKDMGPLWGFWSNEYGWCHLSDATVFDERPDDLPVVDDAEVVRLPEIN
jgi:hypothetical protein